MLIVSVVGNLLMVMIGFGLFGVVLGIVICKVIVVIAVGVVWMLLIE